MSTKAIVLFLIGMLALVGLAAILLSQQKEAPQTSVVNVKPIDTTDQIKGGQDARVILIEYSDFQCPACAAYHSLVNQIAEAFPEDLAVVYRHFPLKTIHQNAARAAQAAEAAGLQQRFWDMHDLLFEGQLDWAELDDPTEKFIAYAQELNLNLDQFRTDLDSNTTKQKVESDYQSGLAVRVTATPTFFLNNKKVSPGSFEDFKSLIEVELSGTSPGGKEASPSASPTL